LTSKPRSPETGPTIYDDLYVRDDHDERIFVDPSFRVLKTKKKYCQKKKRKKRDLKTLKIHIY